jgi:nitroimidazol reductase NimA-like FMN-containing flavoprotein (pyridoxamine 5'-phosphate oxidase superfamily)
MDQPGRDPEAADSPIDPTPRTTIRRVPARGSYDRAVIHAILDEAYFASVGISIDGQPFVIPMVHARLGDELILHGAPASRLLKHAGAFPICATVTLLDGLVLARSAFHHSLNYRSVVVIGQARPVVDEAEKRAAMAALVDHVVPGRAAHTRPPSPKELAGTQVLALPLTESSAKIRTGGPLDDPEDYAHPVWAGHIPLQTFALPPVPDPRSTPFGSSPPLALPTR